MNPYSHLVIAAQLEEDIRPVDRDEYYWGAVAPDVRYTAEIQRTQTHRLPEEVAGFFVKYPELESFTQGYLVHIVSDLIPFRALLKQRVLLWPLLMIVSGRYSTALLEAYYIERPALQIEFSGQPNAILRDLQVTDQAVIAFANALRPFASAPSLDNALGFLQALRPSNPRIKVYGRIANFVEQQKRLKALLFRLAGMEKLNRQILAALRNDEILKRTILR